MKDTSTVEQVIKAQTLHVAVKTDRNGKTRALITNSQETITESSKVQEAHQSHKTGDDSTLQDRFQK